MDYARRSANPVGRLVLHVFSVCGTPLSRRSRSAAEATTQSDRICTALQLINFWQDIAIDWEKGRVYIPQEDLARFGVAEEAIASGTADQRWAALMAFECARAGAMLAQGAPLARALPGRMGLEIRATVEGGRAILDRIEAARGDVFRHRPTLGKFDWMKIVIRAAMKTGVRP
jgi:phytoene/squalene synthetase